MPPTAEYFACPQPLFFRRSTLSANSNLFTNYPQPSWCKTGKYGCCCGFVSGVAVLPHLSTLEDAQAAVAAVGERTPAPCAAGSPMPGVPETLQGAKKEIPTAVPTTATM